MFDPRASARPAREGEGLLLGNGEGAGHVAEAADRIGAPLLQLSTDYVFDGALNRPYPEDDSPGREVPRALTVRQHDRTRAD